MKKRLKKYLIPSEDNNHQPDSLKDKSLRNILLVSILFEMVALVLIFPVFNSKLNFLSAVLPSVLVSETNETRLEKNLGTLEVNNLLTAAAQMKANDMAEKGYFSHVSPDGRQPWHFVSQAGYEYEVAGENLAVNFVDSKQVHEAWMDSPTHRDNILKDKYTEIGIATAKGQYKGKEVIFVAQFFGKPKLIVEKVENIVATPVEDSVPTISNNGSEQVAGVSITEPIRTLDTTETFVEFENGDTEDQKESAVVSNTSNTSSNVNSFLRKILSSPISFVSLIISILLILVSLALLLKIFIKIKIQYPKMIMNGSLVISVLISFYFLNSLLVDLFGEIL